MVLVDPVNDLRSVMATMLIMDLPIRVDIDQVVHTQRLFVWTYIRSVIRRRLVSDTYIVSNDVTNSSGLSDVIFSVLTVYSN